MEEVKITSISIAFLALLVSMFLASCSDSNKDSKLEVSKNNSVEVKVTSRSTTEGASTVEELDKDIEDVTISSLKALFGGELKQENFGSEAAFTSAKEIFSKNENITIEIKIYYLKSDEANSIITAYVDSIESSYQIYMDINGKIIGYESNRIIPIDKADG